MNCRFDNQPLEEVFIDLVNSPLSNAFLAPDQLNEPETFYPLKLYVSKRTFLVQIEEYRNASKIFDHNYAYFSSYSSTWLAHAKGYVEMIIPRLGLDEKSFVVELASNDGYLLKNFLDHRITCLGVEPTKNTAEAAQKLGIESIVDFFGQKLATDISARRKKANLIIGNNVFAHVPNINDFVSGLKILLAPKGTVTLEFPHLMQLMEQNQFDTIYHEHFWYFSLFSLQYVFDKHKLIIYDVDELPTHGGSLRIYITHKENKSITVSPNISKLLSKEKNHGINKISYYKEFNQRVQKIKSDFVRFLLQAQEENKKVIGYGAAAKGNTLLNYCGVKSDVIEYVVDASPHKQGKFLPGSHIPVVNEDEIKKSKPDYIIILPWNLKEEIMEQLDYSRKWGARFVVPIPKLSII